MKTLSISKLLANKLLLFSALAMALDSVLRINLADLRVENFRNDSASVARRPRSTREMSRSFFADMRAYLNFASISICYFDAFCVCGLWDLNVLVWANSPSL
jgi:hypothetical protein